MRWLVLGLVLTGPAALRGQAPYELRRADKIELFLQHLGKVVQVAPEVYQSFLLEYELARTLGELGTSRPGSLSGDFIERSLGRLHPEFASAVERQRAGELEEACGAFEALARGGDLYLGAACELHLAEIDHALGRHAASRSRAEAVIAGSRRYLLEDHRACELVALAFRAAGKPLMEYLQYRLLLTDYKEVPAEVERRVKERLAELGPSNARPLSLVSDWMRSVESLIDELDTSEDPTRHKQIEISSALDKLVELQEARERNACSNCGSGDCGGACRSGQPRGSRSKKPASSSRLADRDGGVNLHGESQGDASKVWGLLREREGAEALQGFRARLPERYRRLLEQYYTGLSRGDGQTTGPSSSDRDE